jgi:1-deoxy-D-xylulose-5-phosphate synthase
MKTNYSHMLKTAVDCGKPVSLRYPRGKGAGVALDETLKIWISAKGKFCKRVTIWAVIAIVPLSIGACRAKRLSTEGLHIKIINARFVKPLMKNLF